jgi:CubicO group peptidase (beta-lactamase class C family)
MYQPGTRWMYHTGSDLLGVLIARASGKSLDAFMRERIFEPLAMKDTGFMVPADKTGRLASAYRRDHEKNTFVFFDDARDSRWSRPQPFQSGGGGLVSTADDYLAFFRMMLNKGLHGRERILSRASVELMTTDQLTAEQKTGAELFFKDNSSSWGMGMAVTTKRTELWGSPGRFGWDGGYGTSAYADPAEDMVGILLTQRMMDSPAPPKVFTDFWTTAYAAIND